MKFISFLAVVTTMFGVANGQATLAQKWNISTDASFEYSSLSFELGYTVSSFISNTAPAGEMAKFNIYDEGCKEDGTEVVASAVSGITAITANTAGLNAASGDGLSMDRTVFVNITLDPEAIAQTDLYSEDTSGSQVTAEIRFCVRVGLLTKGATPVEVNFLETLVTLNVDLTDGFEIGSITVEPRDKLVRTANQVYLVIGYLCLPGPSFEAANLATAINQGTVVRVCVKPDAEAEADGIKMRSIDDFTWTRPDSIPPVNQPAITGRNTPAANQLTTLDCTPGSLVCSFETILFAAFYTSPGAVLGSGVASMQFGTTNTGRRLRGDADGRNLQEEQDEVAAAEFELDFDVAGATEQGTSGAASYAVGTVTLLAMSSVALLL
jgi:hypothetical protein